MLNLAWFEQKRWVRPFYPHTDPEFPTSLHYSANLYKYNLKINETKFPIRENDVHPNHARLATNSLRSMVYTLASVKQTYFKRNKYKSHTHVSHGLKAVLP